VETPTCDVTKTQEKGRSSTVINTQQASVLGSRRRENITLIRDFISDIFRSRE
jgi:hypothetical protein